MISVRPWVRGVVIICCLVIAGLALTAWIESANRDLSWARLFYEEGGPHGGWIYARDYPWCWIYDYGEIPAIVMAIVALGAYIAARLGKVRGEYAKPCLVIILTVVLGPGLMVNGLLKHFWGRPRPSDLLVFGGNHVYRKASEPGAIGEGKSFTCGHCSMAFAVASAGAFYPYHPVVAVIAITGGIVFGTAAGAARMIQGGHFLTDVLWSAIIVFVIITALYYLVFRIPERDSPSDGAG